MFENSNTSSASKLPPAKSVSQQSRSSPGMSLRGQPPAFGGSQHLKNLSKAVGAKVNDFLRRKEPANHSNLGVTEVNESAGAVLSHREDVLLGGQDQATGQPPIDAIPRLDPPPLITKKRAPRALKTTQDMLMVSSPLVGSTEAPFLEEIQECTCQPASTKEGEEIGSPAQGEDTASPSRIFSVPDLIHKESKEPRLNSAFEISSSPGPENLAQRLSLSPSKCLPECHLQSRTDPSTPRTSTLEREGRSPDLLSFE